MKSPSILIFSDRIDSVCSFWRSQGVFNELSKHNEINISIGEYNQHDWTTIRLFDIAFFQRPMSKKCFAQIAMCKDLGLKIWIDLDDSNLLPPHHEVYPLWCDEYDEKIFFKIMLLADVVTVSTNNLKNYYLKYSNNIKVIPNAINDYWLPFANTASSEKIVLIRGGGHHLPDIWEYRKEIAEVMNNHPDWKLYVLGGEAHFFKGKVSNYEFKGDFNIHDYFGFILRNKPSIIIVPLCDNELNHGKSNISWQEATLCGASALTPSYWHLNHYSATYKDKKTFKTNFERLITDSNWRLELHQKSLKKVKSEYVLSKVNNQRLEIIKNLVK